MHELSGKVALVTGGARGIGAALGRSLVAEGSLVVLADTDRRALDETAARLAPYGRVLTRELDVTSEEAFDAVVEACWAELGSVDLVCLNAGIGVSSPVGQAPLSTWELDPDHLARIFEVNVAGVHHGIRATVPRLLAAGRPGHVVITGSMAGLLAPPTMAAYASSKHAALALGECLAAETRDLGIGVSILCPGGVATMFNASARQRGAGTADVRVPTAAPEQPDAQKMDPHAVARRVVAAIRAGELYVFTHPEYEAALVERHRRIEAAFGESAQPGYQDPASLLALVEPSAVTRPAAGR